ncbi:ATP-binding protein [Streptomyces sp. NPDC004610]|uniref:sensor histidine kinase n=1 Tax=unclassified Streptomyces TaxID=2593676 RepID=UPI0033A52ED3
MAATFRRHTLAGEMLVLQLAIVVMVLVAVAAVSLAQSKATFDRVEGRRVTALAEQLAATPLVRGQLEQPLLPREALAPLVNSTQTQSGVTSVTIADAGDLIVSSTDPTVIGEPLPRGSGAAAEPDRGWSGELSLGDSRERVAQVPVLGEQEGSVGRVLGTVMIGEESPTVWQRLGNASSSLIAYLGIASGLGLAGSWLLARRIKRQTLGLEPREIAGLAEHREAMLYGIAEGVVALDPQHRLTLVNEVGRRLLELPEDCEGRGLDALGIDGRLRDVLTGGRDGGSSDRRDGPAADRRDGVPSAGRGTTAPDPPDAPDATSPEGQPPHGPAPTPPHRRTPAAPGPEGDPPHRRTPAAPDPEGDPPDRRDDPSDRRDEVVIRGGRILIMNRMTVTKDGRPLGSVTTLRDRTELARLEREIGSFRSSSELLRAQAHEFANQLHTISGLIQIGEQDEVVRYIRALSLRRQSLDVTLSRRVRDTAVAALLTAKSSLAAERRVRLRISDSTALGRLAPEDAADVATVVGNLVDNAVDAAAPAGSAEDPEAWVEVEIRQDASGVEIVVRDSGPGVAPELAREVFEHGFTTKVAREGERGIGLALTRLVCERHGGEIAVTNTPEGAQFTARMTVGRRSGEATEGALRK